MSSSTSKPKRKRIKLECLECHSVFDDDYRNRHEQSCHNGKRVRVALQGAPANPFAVVRKKVPRVDSAMAGCHIKLSYGEGASSGIGAGIARHLATLGCSLVLVGRNDDNLRLVQSACEDRGLDANKILIVKADLTLEKDVKELVKKTMDKFPSLHILVNSAGVLSYGSLLETTVDQLDALVSGNIRSMFLVTKHFTSHLAKTKGSIVNVSSTSSKRASPGLLGYGMTKAAVDHFTKTVAIELADQQIRVNAVSPGLTVTPIYQKAAPKWNPTDENLEEEGKRWHPLGRACTVDDVAKCVAFLVSDDASFTTGEILPVDGGRHIAQSLR